MIFVPKFNRSGRALCAVAIASLSVLLFASSRPLAAQTASSAVILGTITDASNAVVSGAEVKLQNLANGQERTQPTNSTGQYLFNDVVPGDYTLSATKSGFAISTVQKLTVDVLKSYTLNMQLKVGAASETVEVKATAEVELQTTTAEVGDVIGGSEIQQLPTVGRNALQLRQLQPTVTPGATDRGGTVSGARSDQNTITMDGIDISDSVAGGQGVTEGFPANIENVEEFRTGVANSNVTFTRSAGGETALISRSGTNALHGGVYWYHQNDEMNANTWENNRTGVKRAELKDNRVGASVGGPIFRNKTFFFTNYEIHRLPNIRSVTRLVPTATLEQGILQFKDASGVVRQYNLATAAQCGTDPQTGARLNLACDPRGLGISPTVKALWALMPAGNDNTIAGADGLNVAGYRALASAPVKDDQISMRIDHHLTNSITLFGRYFYDRDLGPLSQYDIRNGNAQLPGSAPNRNDGAVLGADFILSPRMTNSFRAGWIRDRAGVYGESGIASAALLKLAGTSTSMSGVFAAIQASSSFLNQPIDNGQVSRTQILNGKSKEIVDNHFWNKGTHNFAFGTDIHLLPFLFANTDKNVATTSPTVQMDPSGVTSLSVPSVNRPPTCSSSITTNCLASTDLSRWNSLYLGTLGIVNNINMVVARDGSLNPLPFATILGSDTNQRAYDFYGQDTWRLRQSLTLTYGLAWGVQTPPTERLNRLTLLANHDNGDSIISEQDYVNQRNAGQLAGTIYNPTLSFLPVAQAHRPFFNTDHSDWAPRASIAWSPSFDSGPLASLFGNRKTVIRGGYGISYARNNSVNNVVASIYGVGFSDILSVAAPSCQVSGTPGGGCASGTVTKNPGAFSFRVGQDGTIPLPANNALTSPIVPTNLTQVIGVDPNRKIGRNHMVDFTIQRELPGNLIVELGYIGRFGTRLASSVDLDTALYKFKDPASGQTFAQAWDNIGCVLRGQAGQTIGTFTCPGAIANQPWFENQLPGLGVALGQPGQSATQLMIANLSPYIINGDVFTSTYVMDQSFRKGALGLPSFVNTQVSQLNVLETSNGHSAYNAGFVTLRKRVSRGLLFDVNYTYSKSLDQQGLIDNNVPRLATPFNPDLQYGPSSFDHRHVLNATYSYTLPFGQGHLLSGGTALDKFIGGWYTAGIVTTASGYPLTVTQGGNYGGALGGGVTGATADIPLGVVATGVNSGVTSSGKCGTSGKFNLFFDPQAACSLFRVPLLSVDTRTGESRPLYGLGFWNADMRLGKVTNITERFKAEISADAFNIFNHPNYANPSLSLTSPASFGVITGSQLLANHTSQARYMQLGLRIIF